MGKELRELEFRTVEEFERHFFPNAVKKEEMERIMRDPGKFGEYVAEQMIKTARRNLNAYNRSLNS